MAMVKGTPGQPDGLRRLGVSLMFGKVDVGEKDVRLALRPFEVVAFSGEL